MSLIDFVNMYKRDLVQLYITERINLQKEGILCITKEGQEANVTFYIFEDLPLELVEELIVLKKKHNDKKSIIYFYLCDLYESQIMELDLTEFDPDANLTVAHPSEYNNANE